MGTTLSNKEPTPCNVSSTEGRIYAARQSCAKANFRGTYVNLIVPKALLDFIKQAAVGELAERRQVIIGSGRHQLDLRENQVR